MNLDLKGCLQIYKIYSTNDLIPLALTISSLLLTECLLLAWES